MHFRWHVTFHVDINSLQHKYAIRSFSWLFEILFVEMKCLHLKSRNIHQQESWEQVDILRFVSKPGRELVVYCAWFGVPRRWALVRGPTALGPGSGSHGVGPWFGVPRRWALVRGPTALGPGSGSHGAGPWFGVPRRWTHPYFCLLKLRQKSSTVCSRTRGLILLSQSCTWLVHTSKSTAAEVSRNNALKTKDLSTEWKVSFMFRIEQLRFTNNKH